MYYLLKTFESKYKTLHYKIHTQKSDRFSG